MFISNDEPFIKLSTAANAYYFDELLFDSLNEKHLEHLTNHIGLYSYVCCICNVYKPIKQTTNEPVLPLSKKIDGMCKRDLKYHVDRYGKASINLKISQYTGDMPIELINCNIAPVSEILNDSYTNCYVRLYEFLDHAITTGVKIDSCFLEPIISDDGFFYNLKDLSSQNPNNKFSCEEAASNYYHLFADISKSVIIQACTNASRSHDERLKNISTKDKALSCHSKELDNNLSTREKDNLYKTIGLLSLAIAKQNSKRFGDIHDINASQIYKALEEFLPEDPIGLGDKTVRTKIKQGVYLLKNS